MILFVGIPSEAPLALAIESAEREAVPHLVLSQRRWMFCELAFGVGAGRPQGALWLNEKLWPLEAFTGIYARMMEPSTLPESQRRAGVLPDPRQLTRLAFLYEILNDWLEIAPGRVVNRPLAMASNASKPYQAQLITRSGFATPPTLITNDPEQVRAFQAQHGRVVYKSISSVRSIVMELCSGRDDLERVRRLPTQFQAFIPGQNVRVHVVGEEVFPTLVESEAVDYRYGGREGFETDLRAEALPPEVAERCVALTAALGLSFAGIDLKRTPDGEWYCFEVNTSPGYSYFQQATGQAISDALVRHLVEGADLDHGSSHGAGRRKSG
ncbi:MAG: hypothetical protein ACJ798_18515 [Phenylobacterium sp.]